MGDVKDDVTREAALNDPPCAALVSTCVTGATPELLASLRQPERRRALARLSHLAALLFDAPIAHVTIMGNDRQHYCGTFGLPAELITDDGAPFEFGFCPTVVTTGRPLLHPDLLESSFRDNAAVTDHGARAYAGTPLRGANGEIVGSLCVLDTRPRSWDKRSLDMLAELAESVVTELELVSAHAALQEQAHAARVIEHLAEGVVLLDDDDIVRLWNPAAALLTGINSGAAIGHPVGALLPTWTQAADSQVLSLDGGDDPRSIVVSGISWPGGSVHALRDITREQRLSQVRDELVTTISHQLRTPLASIYAASITLQRSDVDIDAATRTALLETIEQQAERLTALSDDVLAASRLDAGTHPIELAVIDLERLVAEVAASYSPLPDDAARIVLDVPPGTLVMADAGSLRQVVTNLVDNALRYTPASGRVTVASCKRAAGRRIELSITDEGMGIPRAHRANVFEKFYRLDPQMRIARGGTGLGLYIGRELMRRMGGTIDIGDSPTGPGARFEVELVAAGIAG